MNSDLNTVLNPSYHVKYKQLICFLGDSTDLARLSSQLVEILQEDHEFEMTFERLQDRYLSHYDEELDPPSYGFNSLADLFHSLTSIMQV
jgi:hypothetical protein